MNNKTKIAFFLIIVIALLLRIIYLDRYPPSPNWDEVSLGYNAYSILKTGNDEWGFSLPLIFRAYGDYKLPVYVYISAVAINLFGLNTFAVRLPSALAGVGTVIITYFLVIELLKRKINVPVRNYQITAFTASLLVALEPWSYFLSRGAFEANLALFLFLLGVYIFLKAPKNYSYFPLSVILFGLTVWTYNSYRIFTPIMIVVLALIYKKEIEVTFKKSPIYIYVSVILILAFLIPMFYQLIDPVGMARYEKVEIIDDGTVAQIIEARQYSVLNPLISRFLYNRPVYFVQHFLTNWSSHFSSDFLFFKGGDNYQFSVPGYGLLYYLNFPFYFLGLLVLFGGLLKKEKFSVIILSWLIVAPIPSSITREAPHVLRSITFLPLPMIVSALGLVSFSEWIIKYIGNSFVTSKNSSGSDIFRYREIIAYSIYIILLLFMSIKYLSVYYGDYTKKYSWSWQYGYKQAVYTTMKYYDNYEKIIFSKKYGEPHEFLLFFTTWNPKRYINDPNLIRFYQSNWYWVDGFDKFYFVNDWQIPNENYEFMMENGGKINCEAGSKCLLITSPGNVPVGWNKLETIYFLDETPVFEIYDNSFNNIGLFI